MTNPPSRIQTLADSHGFLLAVALVTLPFIGLCITVATTEWFKNDDFAFLIQAESASWSWARIFFPMGEGRYWSYRPIGLDGFFRFGYWLFGPNAAAFFLLSLTARFAAGAALYRLAKQLGFRREIAIVTAVLSVSRPPTMSSIWWGAGFTYVGAVFFGTLALTLFMDALRGRRFAREGSLGMLALSLGCNEAALVFVGVVGALALLDGYRRGVPLWRPGSFLTAVLPALPHALLGVGWLALRASQVGDIPADDLYDVSLSFDRVTKHAPQLFTHVAGEWALVPLLVLVVATAALALRSAPGQAALRWLAPLALVLSAWALAALAPFLLLAFSHPRFAVLLELPLCLAFGGVLEVAWRSLAAQRRRWLEIGLVGTLLISLPYSWLWTRARNPQGDTSRQLVERLAETPALEHDSTVVLLYGVDELASYRQARLFKLETYGSSVLRAGFPDKRLTLVFHHPEKQPPRPSLLCDQCIYFALSSDARITPVSPDLLAEALLIPGLTAEGPRLFELSATRLALLRGADALDPLLAACEERNPGTSGSRCIRGVVAALRAVGTKEADAASWALAGALVER